MPSEHLHDLSARGIRVTLDGESGQLARFEVERGSRRIAPFARVPWADGPDDPARFAAGMGAHLRRMSGDFFCAPFCADDVEGGPFHGWPANALWELAETQTLPDGVMARFRLAKTVAGASVDKIWVLRDDHPFLYQRHDFTGGTRAIPLAHHAMVDLRTGGLLRFSPKLRAESPAKEMEPGRSLLVYPGESADPTAFPGRDGPVDLTRYPFGRRHEDFAMLIDDPAQSLGWATALRPACGDVAMLLKPVARLPQTMLWISNGGRDYEPWCGQHVGVLGIEEACSFGAAGWAASVAPNRLTAEGIATAVDLSAAPVVRIATAMGALPCDAADGVDLALTAGGVRLSDGSTAPFDASWLDQR